MQSVPSWNLQIPAIQAGLNTVADTAQKYNYPIHNIFMNSFLSLIAHELSQQIYLHFMQMGGELVELLTIL
jgi:hypothetical protein